MKDLSLRLKWCISLSLLLLLAGCLFRDNEQTSTAEKVVRHSTDPVTVDFWHTFNDEETGTLKEALASFKKDFPYISVKLQQVPFSDALNKYKTVAQAGNAPDIFRAEIAWTTELASMGYLMSLDAFINKEAQTDFIPQALAYSRYDNHIWGFPQVTDCLALFYNKRLVGPEAPKTLEQLLIRGQELTIPGKQYAFFYRGDPYWFTPFVWAFGGDLIDSQSLKVKIAEEPAVKALNFLIDLRKKYKIVPDSVDFANDYENMQIGFKNAQYAMIINGPWSTASLLDGPEFKDNPDNLGIARIPQGPGGWGSPVGGHNYVIASSTKKLWASWEVINYLNRPEIQALFALKNNLLPTRKSTYELPAIKANRIIQSFKHVLDAANTRPVIPQSGAIFNDLRPAYQAALLGEKPADVALKEVEEAWKRLLSSE
jgi:arabinogalactan oligomer / maltooligosaccharide transport system substrate-binding protein